MKHIKRCMAVALLALGLAPMQGLAAATTATMTVTLVNVTSIATLSTTPINFGSVLATTAKPWGSGTITANVGNGTPFKLSLNGGKAPVPRAGNPFCRRLTGATRERFYSLYPTQVAVGEWGDSDLANSCAGGSGSSRSYTGTGADTVINVFAQARLTTGTSDAGLLSDTLTVTLTY